MKPVSFKVAKYLKEVGYPQDIEQTSCGYSINSFGYYDEPYDYDALYNYHHTHPGEMLHFDLMCRFEAGCEYCVAPSYMETWLWLWREKKIWIQAMLISKRFLGFIDEKPFGELTYDDPEEAIISAIDYLVEHNLILK